MPYDPRHCSEGGNRTTTSNDLKAPTGKYRVVLVDTFDGGDCVIGDYQEKEEAIKVADKEAGQMTKLYVYDDQGKMIHNVGTF